MISDNYSLKFHKLLSVKPNIRQIISGTSVHLQTGVLYFDILRESVHFKLFNLNTGYVSYQTMKDKEEKMSLDT